MIVLLTWLLLALVFRFNSRARLEAENLALRQQLIVLSRKPRSRIRLRNIDRLIFVWPYSLSRRYWTRSSSLSRKPLYAGVGAAFAHIGTGDREGATAVHVSTGRSVL